MVIIRLSRKGRKKAPFYRIVAADSRKKATGAVLEILGTWKPSKKDLKIDKKAVEKWVQKGAQVTSTVKKLIS